MPSLKDRDLNAALDRAAAGVTSVPERPANPQQTVALEVPVTVNGARTLDGNDKREPFSESTKTVLVHSNGAVIRLAATVAAGQLLFLTNEKTKKEVVCQVLKSKTPAKANGYVELQFTEPNPGFWGTRSPSEPSPRPDTLLSPDPTDFLAAALPTPSAGLGGRADSKAPSGSKPEAQKQDPSGIHSLKTDPKADQRATNKADFLAPADTSTASLKLEANRLQEQLSSLLFTEQPNSPAAKSSPSSSNSKALSDTTAKLFEIAEANTEAAENASDTGAGTKTPAAPNKPSFDAAKSALPPEELKVPSWLEPLTHNAPATPAPEEPVITKEASPAKESAPVAAPAIKTEPQEKKPKPAPAKIRTSNAAVFGNTLLGQNVVAHAPSHGSNRGLVIGAIAATLVVASAAAWYFLQPSGFSTSSTTLSPASRPANSTPSAANTLPAVPAPGSAAANPAITGQSQPAALSPKQTSGLLENSSSVSAPQITAQPAVMSEKVPNPGPVANSAKPSPNSSVNDSVDAAAEPQPARPSLGRIRLAKPKVHRTNQAAGIDAPSLADNESEPVPTDASLGAGLAAETATQPGAPPTPVGGDVKPARLVSSVPPVYPAFAKTQHVSGDVRIDALIDATGRVSSMKVVSGPGLLHQAAMDALRQWKYQPATLNGSPVATRLTVTLQFHLQ